MFIHGLLILICEKVYQAWLIVNRMNPKFNIPSFNCKETCSCMKHYEKKGWIQTNKTSIWGGEKLWIISENDPLKCTVWCLVELLNHFCLDLKKFRLIILIFNRIELQVPKHLKILSYGEVKWVFGKAKFDK